MLEGMTFLRSATTGDLGPQVTSANLSIRPPQSSDYPAWAELRARSREFLTPWEPTWSRDELSRAAYKRRLRHYQKDLREETGYAFLIFRRADGLLVGGLTLSNVRRGVTQATSLGYWMGAPFANRGLMSEAVRAIMPFAFATLWLHRLEAACIPHNLASIRVLERAGFVREGLARRYLRINGIWQDHYLYAALADDPRKVPERDARMAVKV